jgi:serine/threonine protein kinase
MIGGRFEVQQLIRRDFAGTVYSAKDGQSQRDVECLLINLAADDTHQLLELRAHIHEVKKLKLKSFASTYGIGKQGQDGYLVRQKVEGRPLTDHLNHRSQNHRPFKQRGLCSLLIEIIQALEALEAQKVEVSEHGVLRPNIVMIQNQSKPRVRLTDVGLGSLRHVLVKNQESDPWTRGCIPELRGESHPQNPDLYALGALLFQMTQLRPFTKGWLRELSVSPTFSQLPDLIEACTSPDPLITLTDLKSELKYAAQSQVENGGLTKDLSQLQERLQKIIHYETSSIDEPMEVIPDVDPSSKPTLELELPDELIAAEPSVSIIFDQLPSEDEGHELSQTEPIFLTPVPTSAYLPAEAQVSSERRAQSLHAPAEVRYDEESPNVEPQTALQMSDLVAESEPLLRSEYDLGTSAAEKRQASNFNAGVQVDMSAMNDVFNHSLEEKIETLHGVELEDLDDEGVFASSVSRYASLSNQDSAQGHKATPPPLAMPMSPELLPLIPPPPAPNLPYDDDLSGQRWIVVRDGIDYGPYTLDELSHQLFREEIGLETEICDIETDQRAALGEFTSLDHVLNEWAKERLERKKQRAAYEKRAKVRRRFVLIAGLGLIGVLIFSGVTYGPQLRAAMLPAPANVNLESWVTQAPKMKRLERLKENPNKRRERERLRRAEKAKLETLRDAKAMAKEAREAAEASTVDFNRRGAKLSRFSRSAFDRALANRSGRLLKCIEAEHGRFPDKEVLKVTMSVQRTGRFLNARLVGGSGPGVKCVFRAIQGLKMSPFSGGDKTITLPYKVK